jgi:hypothetical protein
MSEKLAIVTGVWGDDYKTFADVSLPLMRAYAQRIGCDFAAHYARRLPDRIPHWEKMVVMSDALGAYDRVAWVDVDALINPAAPSIFDTVSPGYPGFFGAFDEGKFINRESELQRSAAFYGMTLPTGPSRWHAFFNTGVMVADHSHADTFRVPDKDNPADPWPENTYLNLCLMMDGVPSSDIGASWNVMTSVPTPRQRHVVHYAGWHRDPGWPARLAARMRVDLAAWGWDK